MATIAAYKLATEKEYAPNHRFRPAEGGSRLRAADGGKRGLRDAVEGSRHPPGELSSYVFQDDIVPHLPPVPGFVHFGRTFVSTSRADGADFPRFEWQESTDKVEQAPVTALGDAAVGLVSELTTVNLLGYIGKVVREGMTALGLKGRRYSFYDHSPTNYVACSQLGDSTEFGNDF
jgi:hypothetical protein